MSANVPDLKHIFKQIDTDKDGFVSRTDIEETEYAALFDKSQATLSAISSAHDGKISFKDFQLLYHAHSLTKQVPNVIQAVVAKFQAAKFLDKYNSVSAPGAAGPSVKQSFLKLAARSGEPTLHQHSISIEFGVDKPIQQQEIHKITQALGHKPHEVFFLLKFHCKSKAKGDLIASTLQQVVHQVIDTLRDLAPDMQPLLSLLKVYAKYSNEYIYLVAEVDNPFVDAIIGFFNEVIQALSPECSLKFKAKLTSVLSNLLKEDFNYEKSSGEIALELDIDSVTLHKLKQIMGDNLVNETENQPINVLFSLLFEEIKMSADFTNLGEALSSTFNQDVSSFPKPYDSVATIKSLGIKQIAGQLFSESTDLIANIKEHCKFEGELSLNLHDIYVKLSFDLDIEQAFDLL